MYNVKLKNENCSLKSLSVLAYPIKVDL